MTISVRERPGELLHIDTKKLRERGGAWYQGFGWSHRRPGSPPVAGGQGVEPVALHLVERTRRI